MIYQDFMSYKQYDKDIDQKIKELYLLNPKPLEISRELNVSYPIIKYKIKKLGLPRIKNTYLFDKNFFDQDNELSFYWAGFIAADGCLLKRKGSFELKISLALKDIYLLEKFKEHIKSTHPISLKDVKSTNNISKVCSIVLLNPDFEKQLSRFNITLRKTKIYKFPDWIINHELVNHFMRGYFDGDGSFYNLPLGYGRTVNQVAFNILGTKDFIEKYKATLEQKAGIEIVQNKIRPRSSIYSLEYGGNNKVIKIRDFLYKDATMFLPRKYDKVKDLVQVKDILNINSDQLLKLAEEKGSFEEVGKALNKSKHTITAHVYKLGIAKEFRAICNNKNPKITKNQKSQTISLKQNKYKDIDQKIKELYDENINLLNISKQLNIHYSKIKRRVKKLKLSRNKIRKFKYDKDFFENIVKSKGGTLISKEYQGVREKLDVICSNDHKFSIAPRNLISGNWCRECYFNKIRKHGCDDLD